jgi:hypothetical protein
MKKGRKDFIFDMETIGANVHVCPVVDIAYYTFEWDRFIEDPYSFQELATNIRTVKASVKDQMQNYGCSFKKSDVEWWEQLPAHARNKIKPSSEDTTVEAFCDEIISYTSKSKIDYWWSRGNTFDPIILWRLMNYVGKAAQMDQHLKFYMVRDIRTHIDAKFNYTTRSGFVPVADTDYWNESFVAHDSTHDVAADILRLQAIHRAENDLPQVEK